MVKTMRYEEILAEARRLPPDEQRRLVDSLTTLIQEAPPSPGLHSILELEGLGKEVWKDVDPRAYVDRERDAWNG